MTTALEGGFARTYPASLGDKPLSGLGKIIGGLAWAGALSLSVASHAQTGSTLLSDSFRVGSEGGALCQAQSAAGDPAVRTMFDRSWALVCRDAAQPVGQIYALRRGSGDMDAVLLDRLAASRRAGVECGAAGGATLPDIGAAIVRNCTGAAGTYRILTVARGRTLYVAQGYAAYASALDLGLRSVMRGRIVPGKIDIATTGSDVAGFARLQAATLDPQTVLAEGYRRNASGNYAEAAEFFDSLTDRLARDADGNSLTPAERSNRAHEYLVNRGLQLSNLGLFDQADAAFAKARAIPTADAVQIRLRRNFEAMHHINRQDLDGALAILDRPLAGGGGALTGGEGAVVLPPEVAAEMSSGASQARALGVRQDRTLTPAERAAIIDAQAQQLRGTILRLSGQPAAAREILTKALASAVAIRDGRVTSITRLRAQLLGEIALTYEAEGDFGQAEANLNQALALLAAQYPETVALNGARARLGAFLVRHGRNDDALAIYRSIMASTIGNRATLTGMANQLQPYFTLLARQIAQRPELTADLFAASQLLIRPGAADTLEQLSRELSAGNGEAARLFRQSVSLSRDIERERIMLAQLRQAAQANEGLSPQIAQAQSDIEQLAADQSSTLTALAAYPQYRAVSPQILSLTDMQATLKPGEGYFKLAQLGDALYAVWIDGAGATGYRLAASAGEVARKVAALRETISIEVNGAQTTYALDVPVARSLYLDLFAPIDQRLAAVKHLIFEPDGAMLQLPVNLLIASQPGVDAYAARVAQGGDEFDFRGIDWLGRDHAVSTALSARAFRDARAAAPSNAVQSYIGFGDNAPLSKAVLTASTRGAVNDGTAGDCNWSPLQWNRPIPATELREAAQAIGGQGSQLVTGAAFTDEAVMARGDLDSFRILHFATHGLVTPPHPGCPARPALLTSFAPDKASDGLLQFSEIFDLRLNADLVVLSACDTAGEAGVETTRAAGLSGGGGALDGLVRAFIGAGSRAVIASHWPAPEDYHATERLMSGLFAASADQPVAEALRAAQIRLMDDPETSHPFYWSGFAIIGDGARPLIARR
ncbi:CHAT domain-containing protein [Sphingobium sp. Sx8-8]|uniref:CHAT domain-containing protein n=1 Tax=Sphingobium sp. Sx8-8 TaxID=2933617 RepID=UPI001F56BEBA|nr:CHAT domain-containing protein [Sphingobium sp. Sx8-8]